MNSAIFESLLGAIEDDFSGVCVDLEGHGSTPYLGRGFDAQVEALAEQLPASTLLGWSMGGLYAIALARRFPGKFPAVVLVACNPCFVQQPDWGCAVDRAVFDEFSRGLIDNWQLTMRRFIGLQLKGVASSREMIRHITELLQRGGEPDSAALEAGLQLLLNYDARADLQALKQPVMLVLGERDTLVPVGVARQIRMLKPALHVECVARSAHAPFITHTEIFAELLRGFTESSQAG
jgi:pimeloyl-[acyl-carrier protein] methyl ester esterase